MDEKPKSWYECTQCGIISDAKDFRCTPHWKETPRELSLPLKEVVRRVRPNLLKIWATQPSELESSIAEVQREGVEAVPA